jgi:hypothetical protein
MASIGARGSVHNEVCFLDQAFEDSLRLFDAALDLELLETLFTRLTQLYLATPFRL